MKEDKKILFVHVGGHEIHEKLSNSVTQNSTFLHEGVPRGYDVYVFEGTYIKPAIMKLLGMLPRKSKIIVLFPDPRLFYLDKSIKFDKKKQRLRKISRFRKEIYKFFLKKIDGALFMGKFLEEIFRKYNNTTPSKVVYGFIQNERYRKLIKIKPSLENHNILFIGDGPDPYCKGLDLTIESFKEIKKKFPDARLNVLGRRWKIQKGWLGNGIFFHGRKDILPYLKKSSLCIHLGRGEGFGINVIESMLSGVPAIVSCYTGSKEIVAQADRSMIAPLKKEEIIKKVESYFNESEEKKEHLSKKIRVPAKRFNETKMINHFRKEFGELLQEIYSKSI